VYTRAIGSSFDSIGLHIITARYLPGGLDSHRWYKSPQIEARIDVVPKKRVTSVTNGINSTVRVCQPAGSTASQENIITSLCGVLTKSVLNIVPVPSKGVYTRAPGN
jgi:hypothetical protein